MVNLLEDIRHHPHKNRLLGQSAFDAASMDLPDICDWAEECFYITDHPDPKWFGKPRPIELMPHQKEILREATRRDAQGFFVWGTVIYSTIKKSGKTAVSALYSRWAGECWGYDQEIYNMGNKLEQAKGRAFKIAKKSIERAPERYRKDWDLQATVLTHVPSGSVIKALPIAGAAEAGANQALTVWTELWGFQYDDALLMWDEMKPVATRPLSQRFVDTYAGFEGVSQLLWDLEQKALEGEQLHEGLPLWGNAQAGILAYLDRGVEARRMPWQQGYRGRKYYQQQQQSESPVNYRRHHLNQWGSPQDGFIDIALWDRLEVAPQVSTEVLHNQVEVVVALDGSVNGDCFPVVVCGYEHSSGKTVEYETHIVDPAGAALDYETEITPILEGIKKRYKVRLVVYDEYQLHYYCSELAKRWRGVKFEAFGQGSARVQADTELHRRIRQDEHMRSEDRACREHVQNADAKQVGDSALRIVKRAASLKVDAIVAISMGAYAAQQYFATGSTKAVRAQSRGLYNKSGGGRRGYKSRR